MQRVTKEQHAERARLRYRAWRLANPEKAKMKDDKWRELNPEKEKRKNILRQFKRWGLIDPPESLIKLKELHLINNRKLNQL